MTPLLCLQINDARWRKIPKLKSSLERAAAETLEMLPKTLQRPCSISVLLGTNAAIRTLNYQFRGIDKPTNVLSFPQFETGKELRSQPKTISVNMGDIAIAYQYVVLESKLQHKILINHLTHLIIHGILHLFGYDHLVEIEAERMERLEKRIMTRLGLPDPYNIPVVPPKKSRPKRMNRTHKLT